MTQSLPTALIIILTLIAFDVVDKLALAGVELAVVALGWLMITSLCAYVERQQHRRRAKEET